MTAVAVLTEQQIDAIVQKAVDRALASRSVREDRMMTRSEVAKLLHVNPKVVLNWIRRRGLPGSKVVGQWRFSRAAVLGWKDKQAKETD